MENLLIDATEYTPKIILDATQKIIDIRGDSFPENTYDFYKPVMQWVGSYFQNNEGPTNVTMEINYFNSSSSQLFFDLFDLFDEAAQNGHNLTVDWRYNEKNESAMEAGEDFADEFESFTINLIEF